MDYKGQAAAELLMYRMLVFFAAVGFLAGYATGSFALMVQLNAGGVLLTLAAVVPDWPWFNRHPLNWLPPLNPDDGKGGGEEEEGGGFLKRTWRTVKALL